jgi:hypothetical protein
MWNPDKAPQLSFEKLARRFGLAKARAIWDKYRQKLAQDEHEATQQERAWAAERHRKGPNVVRNDFDFYPTIHISPLTFKKLHRETLGLQGHKGGERLDDEDYMKAFLKRNPECAPQRIVIRSGWTAAIEKAAMQGKRDRFMPVMRASAILDAAAKQQPTILV